MEWFPASKDHLPLTWWKQTPVYLAAVVALAAAASMVITTLLMAIYPASVGVLVFSVDHVFRGWIWTLLTYIVVNPPGIMFVLSCYFFWNFGEAVERHLGRWSFVKLLGLLVLVSPVLMLVLSLVGGGRSGTSGFGGVMSGVFIAFATLYPTAQISIIILTVEARILVTVIVGVSALQLLAARDWAGLFLLAGQVAAAVGYIRYEQGRLQLPVFLTRPKRTPLSKPKPSVQRDAKKPAGGAKILDLSDVDDILEKISRHGIASLTEAEKRTLEQASDKLGKRRP